MGKKNKKGSNSKYKTKNGEDKNKGDKIGVLEKLC